jgi:hypothetical protein
MDPSVGGQSIQSQLTPPSTEWAIEEFEAIHSALPSAETHTDSTGSLAKAAMRTGLHVVPLSVEDNRPAEVAAYHLCDPKAISVTTAFKTPAGAWGPPAALRTSRFALPGLVGLCDGAAAAAVNRPARTHADFDSS